MIQAMLADMDAVDRGRPPPAVHRLPGDRGRCADAARWAAICKLVAGDTAMRVTTDAVQVLGRLRLRRRVPGRADDARREDHPALRGNPADPAADRRPVAARAARVTATADHHQPSQERWPRANPRPDQARSRPGRGRRAPRPGPPARPGRLADRRQRQRRVRARGRAPARRGARRRGRDPGDGPGQRDRDDAQGARDGRAARHPRHRPGARGRRPAGDDPRPRGGRGRAGDVRPAAHRPRHVRRARAARSPRASPRASACRCCRRRPRSSRTRPRAASG